jgi:hypothetical protein
MNHAAKYPSRCFGVVLSLFLLLAISVSRRRSPIATAAPPEI